jgi:hypothetical protein
MTGATTGPNMSARIDKSWVVSDSIENREHDRCVDLFRRPDGTFGFEEFRRDLEDASTWTLSLSRDGRRFFVRGSSSPQIARPVCLYNVTMTRVPIRTRA